MTTTTDEVKGTWREVRCIEVARPCGCREMLFDKNAIKSKADKFAAKACYQCQLKARQAARRARSTKNSGPGITIGDYS